MHLNVYFSIGGRLFLLFNFRAQSVNNFKSIFQQFTNPFFRRQPPPGLYRSAPAHRGFRRSSQDGHKGLAQRGVPGAAAGESTLVLFPYITLLKAKHKNP